MGTMRELLGKPSKLRHFLILAFITKFFSYLMLKGLYPLVPFLENDWEITRDDFANLLAVSEITAIPAVLISPLADKYNIKVFSGVSWIIMSLSVVLLSLNFFVGDDSNFEISNSSRELISTNSNSYIFIFTIRILFSLSLQVFLTTNLTILLTIMPKEQKEASAGIVEYSWAISTILGIPMLTYLYGTFGIFWCFMVPGVLMVLVGIDLLWYLVNLKVTIGKVSHDFSFVDLFHDLKHFSFVLHCLHVTCLMLTFNGLFTVISFWYADKFDIAVEEVGIGFFVFGIAEFVGSISYSLIATYKSTLLFKTALCATIIYVIFLFSLSFVENYFISIFVIAVTFFCFEITAVTVIVAAADFVELKHRNTALSVHSGFGFLGRSVGALLGERFYTLFGFSIALYFLTSVLIVSIVFLISAFHFKPSFSDPVLLEKDGISEYSENKDEKQLFKTKDETIVLS